MFMVKHFLWASGGFLFFLVGLCTLRISSFQSQFLLDIHCLLSSDVCQILQPLTSWQPVVLRWHFMHENMLNARVQ